MREAPAFSSFGVQFRQASGFQDFEDVQALARLFEDIGECSQAFGDGHVVGSGGHGCLVCAAPLRFKIGRLGIRGEFGGAHVCVRI